jgi:hypothetical protein
MSLLVAGTRNPTSGERHSTNTERTRRGDLAMWMLLLPLDSRLLLRLRKETPQNKSKASKKVDFLAHP